MKRTLQILALALLTIVGGVVGGYLVNADAALTTAERSKLRNGLGDRTFANRVADLLDELDAGTLSTEHITSTDDATITDALTVGEVQTTENVGTAGTAVTAVEYGDSIHHVTKLTLASAAYVIGDAAALCDSGVDAIYTFPAGEVVVESVSSQVSISLTTGTPTTDTPEICIGTTAGSGANATCGDEAATLEDLGVTDVAADLAGTVNTLTAIGPTADTAGFVVADAAAHTVYLNICDTWADVDDTAATISGDVWIRWSWYGNPA